MDNNIKETLDIDDSFGGHQLIGLASSNDVMGITH